MWNSRLIHQSAPASEQTKKSKGFARIAFMVSYGRVQDRVEGAEARMLAMLLTGRSSNAWPQLAQVRSDDAAGLGSHERVKCVRAELTSGLQQPEVEALLPEKLQGRGLGLEELGGLGLEEASRLGVRALRALLPRRLLRAVPPSPSP